MIFNNRATAETIITHLIVNWPSPTAEFYTRKMSQTGLEAKHSFSVHLLQDNSEVTRVDVGGVTTPTQDVGGVTTPTHQDREEGGGVTTPTHRDREEGGGVITPTQGGSVIRDEHQRGHSSDYGEAVAPPKKDSDPLAAQAHQSSGDLTQFGAMWSDPPPFNVSWASMSCQSHMGPLHNGRGTYVYRLSPSGDMAALVVNEKKARDIRVLFFSPLTPGELSTAIYPPREDKQTGR